MIRAINRHRDGWILLAGSLLAGLAALSLGFAPDWDTLNYHLYNPHALLQGRLDIDLAPAQIQTYLNPLFHLPHYLAFRFLHPGVLVFLIGALQGSQWLLLGLILTRLLQGNSPPPWALWIVAALGLGGPIFLAELGGTPGDTVLSILVLGGVLLLLRDAHRDQSVGREQHHQPGVGRVALMSGLLLGLASALKLVFALYAMALGLALVLCKPAGLRWRFAGYYAGGCALGFLVGGGAWFAYLWLQYQNPFFPYFNGLFHSPWIGESSWRDLRFVPVSWFDWLAYPVVWLAHPERVWEWSFRDIRVVALYPLLFLAPLLAWRQLGQTAAGLRLILVFLAFSYVLWLAVFSIYRYLAVMEMLAPLLLFSLACTLTRGRWVALLVAALVCSQLLVSFQRAPAMWELRADRGSSLRSLPANALVVIDGYEPVSFAALWLADQIPLVRIRANFMNEEPPASGLRLAAEQRVRDHSGPAYLLHARSELNAPFLAPDLDRVGLALAHPDNCQPVFLDAILQEKTGLLLCPLARKEELPFQLAR